MEHALITRDLLTVIKRRDIDPSAVIPPGSLHIDKPYWVPYNRITNDTSTGPNKTYENPVETIYADRVELVTEIRDKTPVEIDAEDDAVAADMMDNAGVVRALAQTLFEVVNDVRVLKGQGTITGTQFKTYLKGLIRQ